MTGYYDETLTPAPPVGVAETVGDSPYPFNDTADLIPRAPHGDDGYVGTSPFDASWDTDVLPKADDHSNRGLDRKSVV